MSTDRDNGLDFIKVLACLLMVVAHGFTLGKLNLNGWTQSLWHLSLIAPVIFYIGFGLSLSYVVTRRSVGQIINSLAILFLMSFADVGAYNTNYLTLSLPNLFGSLAISGLVFVVAYQFSSRIGGWPVMAVLGVSFMGIDRWLNLWPHQPNLIHGDLFSVFPWAGLVLIAPMIKTKVYALGLVIALVAISWRLKLNVYEFTTQLLTTKFLLLGCLTTAVGYLVGSIWTYKPKLIEVWINLIARNTMLFYVLQLIFIRMIDQRMSVIWFVFLVGGVTSAFVYLLDLLLANSYFDEKNWEIFLFTIGLVVLVLLPCFFSSWPIDYYSYFQILLVVYVVFRKRVEGVDLIKSFKSGK